ncbi:hypothetical protein SAMN02982989_2308 [Xaviernesmea oryzae]|uniref:Uncharacterized protein n=1 Tax=Xaviernesmea oryzae TaxID=464029 RepID=A0A1X7F4I8_9HYPH|nr:hypothetical protein [Xaviernesmea oryzae]SMF45781.1 hypothetical protein SAMN02982989_2308 [Xaviernesmea oryzae]
MSPEDDCRKQALVAADADRNDPGLMAFLDAALVDLFECEADEDFGGRIAKPRSSAD